jgi:hypothetical protein
MVPVLKENRMSKHRLTPATQITEEQARQLGENAAKRVELAQRQLEEHKVFLVARLRQFFAAQKGRPVPTVGKPNLSDEQIALASLQAVNDDPGYFPPPPTMTWDHETMAKLSVPFDGIEDQLLREVDEIKLVYAKGEPSGDLNLPVVGKVKAGGPTVTVLYEYPDLLHHFLTQPGLPKDLSLTEEGGITINPRDIMQRER